MHINLFKNEHDGKGDQHIEKEYKMKLCSEKDFGKELWDSGRYDGSYCIDQKHNLTIQSTA